MKKALIIIFILLFNVNLVQADTFDLFRGSLLSTARVSGYDILEVAGQSPIITKIAVIVQVVLSLVGVVFFGLTIYGGYLWMLARGNEEELKKAQKTLQSAIIGLIIVISAYAITYFILYNIGSEVLQ